jgi:hypothetical protein
MFERGTKFERLMARGCPSTPVFLEIEMVGSQAPPGLKAYSLNSLQRAKTFSAQAQKISCYLNREIVASSSLLDGSKRSADPQILGRKKADQRHQQQTGIEPLRVVGLHKAVKVAVETAHRLAYGFRRQSRAIAALTRGMLELRARSCRRCGRVMVRDRGVRLSYAPSGVIWEIG